MSLADDYKELLRAHDGDMVLLYIYRHTFNSYDRDEACVKLDMTMKQLLHAEELLEICKLDDFGTSHKRNEACIAVPVDDVDRVLAFPFEALALYYLYVQMHGADDVAKAAAVLQRSVEQILELKKRLSFLQLLPEQAEQSSEMNPRTPMKEVEQAECEWVPDVDLTPAQPEVQASDPEAERKKLITDFAGALHIHDRPLTPLERKYIQDWINLGFRDPNSITIAYDRTFTNLGRMKWEYTDKIIRSWYSQKLFTPEDILENDKRHRSTSKKSMEREAERAARRRKAASAPKV